MKPTAPQKNWLLPLVVLQAAVIVFRFGPSPAAVSADIPDAAAQRLEIIEQLKITNDKLDKLTTLLSDGNLRVKLTDGGKKHD